MGLSIPDPKPRTLVKFHFTMMIVWILLGYPTIVYWKQSILWLCAMSLYAIVIGHFGAWDGARAEQAVQDKE